MADDESDRVKKIRIFRNGDSNFLGKEFVVNRRQVRSYESFLESVTKHVQLKEAARSLRTPVYGRKVKSLEDIQDKKDYVVVGQGKFVDLGYTTLYDRHVCHLKEQGKSKQEAVDKVQSNIKATGRINTTKKDFVQIYVFCNGVELEPPRKIILTNYQLQSWNQVFKEINLHLNPRYPGCTVLYTMQGKEVKRLSDIRTDCSYIAANSFIGFKRANYGIKKPAFNAFPKLMRKDNNLKLESIGDYGKGHTPYNDNNDVGDHSPNDLQSFRELRGLSLRKMQNSRKSTETVVIQSRSMLVISEQDDVKNLPDTEIEEEALEVEEETDEAEVPIAYPLYAEQVEEELEDYDLPEQEKNAQLLSKGDVTSKHGRRREVKQLSVRSHKVSKPAPQIPVEDERMNEIIPKGERITESRQFAVRSSKAYRQAKLSNRNQNNRITETANESYDNYERDSNYQEVNPGNIKLQKNSRGHKKKSMGNVDIDDVEKVGEDRVFEEVQDEECGTEWFATEDNEDNKEVEAPINDEKLVLELNKTYDYEWKESEIKRQNRNNIGEHLENDGELWQEKKINNENKPSKHSSSSRQDDQFLTSNNADFSSTASAKQSSRNSHVSSRQRQINRKNP